MFLTVPKNELAGYGRQSDRDFFSVPVEVKPLYTQLNTKLIYCESPLQNGAIYPVEARCLKSKYQLTNKQLQSARRIK